MWRRCHLGWALRHRQDFTDLRTREGTFQSRSHEKAGGKDQPHSNPAAWGGGLGTSWTTRTHAMETLSTTTENQQPPFVERARGWCLVFIFSLSLPASRYGKHVVHLLQFTGRKLRLREASQTPGGPAGLSNFHPKFLTTQAHLGLCSSSEILAVSYCARREVGAEAKEALEISGYQCWGWAGGGLPRRRVPRWGWRHLL